MQDNLIPKFESSQRNFFVYSLFVTILSFIVMRGMLLSPSEPNSAVFLGLSIPRLIFTLGLFVTFISFTLLTIKVFRNQEWSERTLEKWFGGGRSSRIITWLAGISLTLGWIGYFLPPYRVGIFSNYWISIRPLMIFLLMISLATLGVIILQRTRFVIEGIESEKLSKIHYRAFLLFLAFLFLLGTMFYSGFGVRISDDFWYGAGVPILSSQLILEYSVAFSYYRSKRDLTGNDLTLLFFC
jgi:hypothetical protein